MSTATTSSKANGRDDVSRQIEALKADIAKLSDAIVSLGKAEAEHAGNRVRAAGGDLKAKGEEALAGVDKAARGAVQDGEAFVRNQPGTAIGIAAAAGFLVGYFASRR